MAVLRLRMSDLFAKQTSISVKMQQSVKNLKGWYLHVLIAELFSQILGRNEGRVSHDLVVRSKETRWLKFTLLLVSELLLLLYSPRV